MPSPQQSTAAQEEGTETPELTEAEREQAICTVLWELAGRALQAARMTGDPRLNKIAAVASEQVKQTNAFDQLLIDHVSQPGVSEKSPLQNAHQQALMMQKQQADQWQNVLDQQMRSRQVVQAEIDRLTASALQELQKRKPEDDGRTSREANRPAASPAKPAAAAKSVLPTSPR